MENSSYSTSSSLAPRNASTWNSLQRSYSYNHQRASDIAGRRMSEASDFPVPEYFSGTGNIARRKASMWDATRSLSSNNTRTSHTYIAARRATICDDVTVAKSLTSGRRASAGCIAGPRPIALLQPKYDAFAEVLPEKEDFTWDYISLTSLSSEKNREWYAGNINYIFDIHNGKGDLVMADIEAIMYIYGVENTSALDIVNNFQPNNRRLFNMNSYNKQVLLASTIKFSSMKKEPLCVLRHASRCYQENLLSPIHFVHYIIHLLKGIFTEIETRFMILGIYSIFGVLARSTNRRLTMKDVETFLRLWKVTKPEEAKGLLLVINWNTNSGTISCREFYNLLYRPDMFGKQRIEMFDTQGKQNPSMFFHLIDKDGDGFISFSDLRSFAAIFGRYPSDESIVRVTRKLDMDGDSKISLEDFGGAMEPILDGITWEFWLVAILITLDL